jgi:hypothetical protein
MKLHMRRPIATGLHLVLSGSINSIKGNEMKENRNKNESQNGRIIYLHDHAVIKEFSEPITFDTVATAYELLEGEIEHRKALSLELIKMEAEVQYWKDRAGKQKELIRSLTTHVQFAM